MKKTAALILTAFIALSAASCGELPDSSFVGAEASAEVTMTAQFDVYSPDFERMQFTLTNGGDTVIEFGSEYVLEMLDGDGWKRIGFGNNTGFNSLLYMLSSGGSHSFAVSRNMFDHDFGEGRYRVVKELDRGYAVAEFEIAEGGIGKDNPYGYFPLETLPREYYPYDAASDGCVDISLIGEADSKTVERFLRDYINGAASQLRYYFTLDDGLYICDILYERPATDRIRFTFDATRAGGDITVSYFSAIVSDGKSVYLSDSYTFDADRAVPFLDGSVWEGMDATVRELSEKSGYNFEWYGTEVSVWSPDGMRNVQFGRESSTEFGVTVIFSNGGNSGMMNFLPNTVGGERLESITDAEWLDEKTVKFTVATESGTAELLFDTEAYEVTE